MAADQVDPPDHDHGSHKSADGGVNSDDESQRDAGQHAMSESITEEAHASQHHPSADH